MIESLNKLTIGHFFYVLGAGAAAGFLFVLLDTYLITPVEPMVGVTPAQAVV